MSDVKNPHNELDPRLQQMLAAYGSTPERDPESARRTQAGFMAELDRMFVEQTRPRVMDRRSIFSEGFSGFYRIKDYLTGSSSRRSVLLVMTVITVVCVYLLGGVGITAYAARSSLPGEGLYPIKTTLENVQANLTTDSPKQARLYLDFARRRLIEMQALIAKGRYNDIPAAASEYEKDIQKALGVIEHLSQTDRIEALALNTETANLLRIYRRILTQLLVLMPPDNQSAIQSAIIISHSATGDDDDNHETAGPTPTPTNTPTPTVPALQPTGVNSTPTPALGNNGNGGSTDRKDDGSKDDDGNGNNAGQGGDDDGDDDDDDDGGDDDDGDDDSND